MEDHDPHRLDSAGAWLGQLVYRRVHRPESTTGSSTADWRCEIQLPEEHFDKLLEAWKPEWYSQLKAQVEYTDAETKAFESLAECTAQDYKSAARVSKIMQRGIPSWSTGTEEGMKE